MREAVAGTDHEVVEAVVGVERHVAGPHQAAHGRADGQGHGRLQGRRRLPRARRVARRPGSTGAARRVGPIAGRGAGSAFAHQLGIDDELDRQVAAEGLGHGALDGGEVVALQPVAGEGVLDGQANPRGVGAAQLGAPEPGLELLALDQGLQGGLDVDPAGEQVGRTRRLGGGRGCLRSRGVRLGAGFGRRRLGGGGVAACVYGLGGFHGRTAGAERLVGQGG
jgi:hypothetical protein